MDNVQNLINRRNELYEQINILIDEYIKKRQFIHEGDSSEVHNELVQIDNEIHKCYKIIYQLDDEIKLSIPPVKTGKLVDLRIMDESKNFNIFLHNQSIEIGTIEYREYHCSEYLGDVGYIIDEKYRGHGYATEALELLSEKLYEEGITDFCKQLMILILVL